MPGIYKKKAMSKNDIEKIGVVPDSKNYDGDRNSDIEGKIKPKGKKDNKISDGSSVPFHRRKLHGIIYKPEYTAVVIGLNPSTANDQATDPTFTKTGRFLAQYGVSDFYMLNLFTTISSDPIKIKDDDITAITDFKKYRPLLNKAQLIVAAWGTTKWAGDLGEIINPAQSQIIDFLKKYYKDKVYCVSDKKTGEKPLHPRRYSYTDDLVKFFDD